MSIYYKLVNRYNWSLKDIDETSFETLLDFLNFKDNDPNTRVIGGKTYRRAQGIPGFL